MRIRYTVPFATKTEVPDHWAFPVAGGTCRVVEKEGVAEALEIVFDNQPVDTAPVFVPLASGDVKYEMRGRDHQLLQVRVILEQAMAFLQCYSGVGLLMDHIRADFEAETEDERPLIQVSSVAMGKQPVTHRIDFSMFTRAAMAAEEGPGPVFESTLLSSAREALAQQRFIDSFRYSFLLIEFLFGEGKFKNDGLKKVLKDNAAFVALVDRVLSAGSDEQDGGPSEAATLLASNTDAAQVIDHLVDQRGFYFHGNIKRRDTWKPDCQQGAKRLAFLAISIAFAVAHEAAAAMFDERFTKRHVDHAYKAGARIVLNVDSVFVTPEDGVTRNDRFRFNCPGTKITAKLAQGVAREFFAQFEHRQPTAALRTVTAVAEGTGEEAFEMNFYTGR